MLQYSSIETATSLHSSSTISRIRFYTNTLSHHHQYNILKLKGSCRHPFTSNFEGDLMSNIKTRTRTRTRTKNKNKKKNKNNNYYTSENHPVLKIWRKHWGRKTYESIEGGKHTKALKRKTNKSTSTSERSGCWFDWKRHAGHEGYRTPGDVAAYWEGAYREGVPDTRGRRRV